MSEPSVDAFSITDNAGGSAAGVVESSQPLTLTGTSITIISGSPVVVQADLQVQGNIHVDGDITAGGSCC